MLDRGNGFFSYWSYDREHARCGIICVCKHATVMQDEGIVPAVLATNARYLHSASRIVTAMIGWLVVCVVKVGKSIRIEDTI